MTVTATTLSLSCIIARNASFVIVEHSSVIFSPVTAIESKMSRVSFVRLGGVTNPAPAALALHGEGAVHLRHRPVAFDNFLRCTSCRFWPQVAFAWIVAWLARLNTEGKRPVDELNLKSLAGLTRRLNRNISYHRPGQKPGWPGEGPLPWRARAGRFSTGGIRVPVTREPVWLTW